MTGRGRRSRPEVTVDTGGQVVTLPVLRQDRLWVTPAGDHGVIVHARTLRRLQSSAQAALALRTDAQPPPTVRLQPQSPELDALAEARHHYLAALGNAVRSLRASGTCWSDIEWACQVRNSEARAAAQARTP